MPRRKALLSFSVLLLATGCAQNQKVATETTANKTVISSTPPFETREPERYRATRTISSVDANGKTTVTKTWIARDGELRRDESENAGQRVVQLILPEGRFVLLPEEKLFADVAGEAQTNSDDEESDSSPDRLLHTEPINTQYQHAGAETIGGRNTQKYRVVVNSAPGTNVSLSETVIWIDETLHMPIKSETSSSDGARSVMELSELTLDVDRSLFQIPDDYKKIAFSELQRHLKKVE